MILLSLILGLVALATLIYFWTVHQNRQIEQEFAKRNLKYVQMGNLFSQSLNKEPVHLVKEEAVKREGPIFGFTMLNRYTIMVADADIVQTILNKEFTNFPNRREFPAFNKMLTQNVAMVQDEQWKRLRSIASPAFTVGKLKRMKPNIDDTVQTLIKNLNANLEENTIQNIKPIFDAFTIDTIIQIAFGMKVDSLNDPSNPIITNGRKLFQQDAGLVDLIKFTVIFFIPKLAALLNLQVSEESTDYFTKFSVEIINQKRAEFAKQTSLSTKANSFIEIMLEAEAENKKMSEKKGDGLDKNANSGKKSNKFMTNEEIISQCVMFFLAGFDTTSTALTLAAYRLALNPDQQDKLYEEIISIYDKLKQESEFSNSTNDPFSLVTYDNLPKFEYLTAVVNESLRIESPGIFVEREVAKDMELANSDKSIQFRVKKGDVIHVPVFSIHRDPKYFPEPDKFLPERFLTESGYTKNAYLPFGTGPRNCIAKSMALLEAKLALLHIVRNFRFEVCEQTKIPLEFYNQFDLITPKDASLRIVKRDS